MPISQGRNNCALASLPPGEQANILRSFPKKKRNNLLPFFRTPLRVAHLMLFCPRTPHVLPAAHLRPIRHSLPRPSHKQKMRARSIAPRTRSSQKSVDFSLKKNTRRHARLSRSCFGRNRRPAFTTALFPFSKEKKKENRSKFSRFEYIARTHFVRPHDVRDWPVAPRPLKFM